MDSYVVLRYIIENNISSENSFELVKNLLNSGCSPFLTFDHDQKNLFELAIQKKLYSFVKLFIYSWSESPNWMLHEEIYKINDINDILIINYFLLEIKSTTKNNMILNQLLNIVHLKLFLLCKKL